MKNFGFLNGHSDEFLWYNSLLWKTTNLFCFPIWGFLFDKIGFKRLYRMIISLEILICGICYYISYNKLGYIIYNFISALVNSGNLAIRPINFGFIFDNEKGAFLFGFSCFLTNTFYIFRPLIWNLLTDKIYYLIIYLILTLFSMLGFIVLCFFIDEKYVPVNYNNDSNDNEMGEEMKNIDYYDDNDNMYFIDNNEKNGEKEHEETS
jgi:MFS family permease